MGIRLIYSDPRINLLYCEDETYLKFLAMTVHPRVRTSSEEVVGLIEIYNKHLNPDGFEIAQLMKFQANQFSLEDKEQQDRHI
ncbi:hypothetical protein MASR2M69_05980 [Bacteroidota bacterium]